MSDSSTISSRRDLLALLLAGVRRRIASICDLDRADLVRLGVGSSCSTVGGGCGGPGLK